MCYHLSITYNANILLKIWVYKTQQFSKWKKQSKYIHRDWRVMMKKLSK